MQEIFYSNYDEKQLLRTLKGVENKFGLVVVEGLYCIVIHTTYTYKWVKVFPV